MQPVTAGYPAEILSGPMIVAGLLHWGLFVTLSVQFWLYYLAFPNDRQFIKHLVYGIYIVEFVQTTLVIHETFAVFGCGFDGIENLNRMQFSRLTGPFMSGVVACVGQIFYADRILMLSQSPIIPIFVTCISLTSSVAAVLVGVYSFQAGNITQLQDWKTSIVVVIWCGAAALCDVVIAICMTYYLMRNDTGFRCTRIIVTKLIRLAAETGSVTAVVALLNLILLLAFPDKSFYGTSALIVSKLKANTVYMVLNSRIRIVGGRDTYTSTANMIITTGNTVMSDTNTYSPPGMDGRQGQASVVAITKEVLNGDCEMSQMKDKTGMGSVISLFESTF
ncbi:hypothetical protein IW261DRAFT_1559840 [Armillaria novae-zelandiae]|uniref:DUF6534 domain-containing protein n=1 Tax=Armillaria novae-zelandiae TaxID=153914 RepID=A0AA39PMK7_9AGAR|nr:hypothetical protein IW261DRAFT_1559840 [Armillaria novae-zelandiae]